MVNLVNDNVPVTQTGVPLTELQKQVSLKLAQTTIDIVKETLETLVSCTKMSPSDFVRTEIAPRQAPLSMLDERTSRFFKKMMGAVNEEIDKRAGLPQGFAMLAMSLGDSEIRKKMLEGIALPHVKRLMIDLDGMKTSIIDNIIKNDEPTKRPTALGIN